MFGKKQAFGSEVVEQELEKKIAELEQQLIAEKSAHEADKTALQELRGRIELEEQTFSELQGALRQRIRELDERTRQHESEMAAKRKNLEEEQRQKRELFEQGLEQRRLQEEAAIQKRIQAFSSSYNQYLAQIQQAFGHFSDASIQIGKTFLEQDFDISGQFDERLNVLFGNTIIIENMKEDPDNSFTLRADAPAKE